MKIKSIFSAVLTFLILTSCGTTEPLFKFENFNYEVNNKKRTLTVNYQYITIANASRSKALQAIEQSLRYEFFQLDGQLTTSLDRTFDMGVAQFRAESGYDETNIETGCELYVDSEVKVIDRTLTYTIQGYKYTGGAHGLGWRTGLNYDIDSGKQLTLHDFLSDAQVDALPEILCKQLCYDKGVDADNYFDSLTEIGYYPNEIQPSENFRLINGGLEFFFYPYEIGVYAVGLTSIIVTFSELEEVAPNDEE